MMAGPGSKSCNQVLAVWSGDCLLTMLKNACHVLVSALLAMSVAAPLEIQAMTAGDVAPSGAPDGRLDAADLGVMMQFLTGKKYPDSIEQLAGDVAPFQSPDGKLDINDYLLVQKALLGRVVLDPVIQPAVPVLWGDSEVASPYHISGLANPDDSVNVYLGGVLYANVTADAGGLFGADVTLVAGAANSIYVRVLSNNIEGPVSGTLTVVMPAAPPAAVDAALFTVTYSDRTVINGAAGSVQPGSTVVVTLVDGAVKQVTANQDGSFYFSASAGNTRRVATVAVRDASGNQSEPTTVTAVGTIAGTFDVDPSGAASYSIPIVVPPGTAGMTPGLSLNYSSRAGNGALGRGWSLGGMSAITRCAKTIARDGSNGSVNLDANDRFCLDGQRLVAINGGIYGADGTEYRTEVESFARVISYGSGVSPDSFRVWTRSGQIIEYGSTADARFDPQGGVALTWAANRIEDRVGNYLVLKYFEDTVTGEHYPVELAYTGNDAAGLIADNRVMLGYATRQDISSAYVGGRSVASTQRLDRIRAYEGARVVREYRLSYDTGPVSGVSRLQSITECDSSVADAVCTLPLSFSWTDGALGYMSGTTSGSTSSGYANARVLDVNGDGRQDLLVPHSGWWWVNYGDTTGLLAAENTGIATTGSYPDKSLPIDYNSDGLTDLLVPRPGNDWDLLQSGSNGLVRMQDVFSGEGYNNSPDVIDFDGDGRQDIIMMAMSQAIPYLTYHFHKNTAAGFDPAIDTEIVGISYQQRVFDYNNNGVSDLLVPVSIGYGICSWSYLHNVNNQAQSEFTTDRANCYATATGVNALFGDVNGDGLQDLVSSGNGMDFNGPWSIAPNKGTGLGDTPLDTGMSSVNRQYAVQTDYNLDGWMDILYPKGPNWHVYQSTGSGFTDIDTQLPDNGYANTRVMDVNGDGMQDVVSAYGGVWNVHLRKGVVPDQLQGITNGMGVETHVTYRPLSDSSVYTKGTQAVFPAQDFLAPFNVVSQTGIDDGAGGQYVTGYSYAGAKLHLQGRGLLGFREVTSSDPQTGITTVTTFRQDFPYTGMVESSRRIYNGTVIDETDNTLDAVADINGHSGIVFPYTGSSVQRSYDVAASGAAGALVKSVQTDMVHDVSQGGNYGNPASITVTTTAAGGVAYSKQTTNSYAAPDNVNWVLDRLTGTSVRHAGAGQQAITKTSGFSYYPNGLLSEEIIEPNAGPSSPLYLRTAYEYDVFGNKTRVSVTGLKDYDGSRGTETRTTETQYDSKGRFPLWTLNALNHRETYVHDSRFGTRASLTGPNGLTTSWIHDSFGRRVKEVRADGTATTWSYDFCNSSDCPNGGFIETVSASGSSPIRTYRDSLQRVIRTETVGLDGALIHQDTGYDNRGNVASKTRPYFAATGQMQVSRFIFDEFNRPVREAAPDGGLVEYVYTGLVRNTHRHHVNGDYDQHDTRRNNAIDQLVQVIDDRGGSKFYSYDASGNLTAVSDTLDPAQGTIVTGMAYDLRGRKTAMDDPDLGRREYRHNAFGELVWQKDAKNQVVTMNYDRLGRMVARSAPEGDSTWIYDTATGGIGKLASVSYAGSGHSKVLAYDSLGRLITEASDIDAESFRLSYSYDGFSRRQAVTFPSGFIVRNVYNSHGHLTEVRDAANDTAYWTATASDAEGHITSETLGNGLHTLRGYEPANGSLKTISTGTGTGSNVQYLEYAFDALGNLRQRQDHNQTLNETFVYDSLNRLTSAAIATVGVRTYGYDASGNILNKSDFGDGYTYGSGTAGPHAVTEVRNGATSLATYSYDANGNMVSGDGRNITWTSFNKAETIHKGGTTLNFYYDADHNRVKQVNNAKTLYYLRSGAHYEKETDGTDVTHTHYINAGGRNVAIYTQKSDNTDETRYLHSDHLGSTDVITDENRQIVERQSFSPFGSRRGVDWSSSTSVLAGMKMHRGFTGHEQLDEVGIIHMNGRLYDPKLGRFLSPDIQVQYPDQTQSFNRYTYVNNNPLSFTDPSGYGFFSKLWKKVRRVVAVVVAVVAAAWTLGFTALLTGNIYAAWTAAGFVGGFTFGAIAAGDIGSAFRYGLTGAQVGLAIVSAYKALSGFAARARHLFDLASRPLGSFGGPDVAAIHLAQDVAYQYANYFKRRLVSEFAEKNNISTAKLNTALLATSFSGNIMVGSRYKPQTNRIVGFDNRGSVGWAFDAVDTVLVYQGIPSASGWHYVISGNPGATLTGHSLGAADVHNLVGLGFASSGSAASLPFGNVAPSGVDVTLSTGDPVSFFGFGKLMNWGARVVNGGFFKHDRCSTYPAFIDGALCN